MDNKKIKKYEKIAKITGILIGLVFILGTSYAVFQTVTRSEETNTISAGKLDVQIENEQDEITLETAYPITEKEGLKQRPYTFSIVNKGTINAEYDLYIEIKESTTLPTDVVRYYLTVEEEGQEKIVTEQARIISQEEKIEREGKSLYKIDTKYIDTTKTNKYKLYLWIDYEATTEQATNKYFEARIVVDSVQIYDKNRLVKQVDVSESGDNSVLAYMYADGTVYLKGKGTLASNLSDKLVYEKEGIVDNYKKLLIQIGCNEDEVSAITSMEGFDEYTNNFDDAMWEKFELAMYKIVFTEMGYDASSITDFESLDAWFIEQRFIDEEGNTTEEGEIFFEEFESRFNEKYDSEPTPATKIVLEDGIENIPNGLYTGNEAITEVRIPASVKSIDDRAFYGCRGLKEITIPKSVTSIGDYAFSGCSSLIQINVDENNENYTSTDGVLFNKEQTTIIKYPEGKKEISYTIPNSVKSIENSAFSGCIGIKKLTIDGTKYYGDLSISTIEELIIIGTGNMYHYTYYDSTPWYSSRKSIKKVTLSDTLTSTGNYTFYRCSSLTSIKIPNSVTSIGNAAFSNCTSLTEIEIPNSVTSIGEGAFSECSSLTNIAIPKSVTSIGNVAFGNCTSLKEIDIPNSVTSIAAWTFADCTSLTSITIPTSVTSIIFSAFQGCSSLIQINVDENNNNYASIDGVLFNKEQTTIIKYPEGKKETSYTIPNSVTSIEDSAFRNCKNLTAIKIPNSVTSIGDFAFSSWVSSQTINIDNTEAYVNANWNSNWKSFCSAQINYLRS